MSIQFNNMNELYSYLETLENRVRTLEGENQALKDQKVYLDRYIQDLGGDAQKLLPRTGLLSPHYIQRAFAVWGHYFVAQLIISVPLTCLTVLVSYLMLKQGINIFPFLPTP
jgi:hypothetical protein